MLQPSLHAVCRALLSSTYPCACQCCTRRPRGRQEWTPLCICVSMCRGPKRMLAGRLGDGALSQSVRQRHEDHWMISTTSCARKRCSMRAGKQPGRKFACYFRHLLTWELFQHMPKQITWSVAVPSLSLLCPLQHVLAVVKFLSRLRRNHQTLVLAQASLLCISLLLCQFVPTVLALPSQKINKQQSDWCLLAIPDDSSESRT